MCRSIKPLRRADSDTTTGEIEAAALQFVRKVSNYRTPSAKNQDAFDAAVAEIADASRKMLETLGVEVIDGPNRWMTRAGEIRYEATGDHAHPHPPGCGLIPAARPPHRGPRLRPVVVAAGSRVP